MPLKPGFHLGPHEILSQLGAGGMGEVYKARDTRLDRIVAVKVLLSHLADKPELRERFEREAKTIANLKHDHICTLYDVGHQDGINYLVLEYLEGETLSQRLQNGPLPLDQALRFAIEIADALDTAHRQGFTHRDIKPGNIMLTKSGSKLLDFGLAKLKQEVAKDIPLDSQAPTPPPGGGLTVYGTVMGTLQYMAPEQAEGKIKEIDGRTDIFSFGAVVYEMVTGKRAFEGGSAASVMSKILQMDPPPMSSLTPMTPPALDRLVKTCLAKEPDDRWQNARDLWRELQWIKEGGSQPSAPAAVPPPPPPRPPAWRRALPWAVALLSSVVIGLAAWILKPSAPQPVSRTVINLPTGDRLGGLDQPAIAISSDGNKIAYIAIHGNVQQLYLRALDSLESKPIAGTEGAADPFFSPDGQWVGFFAGGRLKKISASGGAAVTLANTAQAQGASWGSQERLAFTPTTIGAVQQVSSEGGASQPLTRIDKGEVSHRWPEWLPGGQAVLFSAAPNSGNWTNAQIAVQAVQSSERQNLVQGATQPRYASSGHLLYAQAGTLMAAPFDSRKLAVRGAAVPVLEGLLQSTASGAAQYGASATGTLVYLAGGAEASQRKLVWISRNGEEQALPAPPHAYRTPRVSPEGRRVAVAIEEQESQIWLYDLTRDTLTRLTFEGNQNLLGAWTPDGKRIAFYSTRGGPQNLFWQLADGSGGLERLTTSDASQAANSFSPDGQLLAFIDTNPTTGKDLWALRLSDRKVQPFLRTPYEETAPKFSPDGRWLAYSSDESGRREVYVQPYPGPGGKWQISTEGGQEPVWNPNGRELFYRSGQKMMAVDVNQSPDRKGGDASAFTVGKPRLLFEGAYTPAPASFPNYDVSPDGQRFLMLKPVESQAAVPTQINVVQNWFEELKRKVPAGR